MFPYPSGAGLHVGHPLGYIASDIYSRYKRLKGFNVLHPMGFDSFGLPAEQYAIETGQHPADTTEKNITTFKKQLDKIGFCYDWEREVRTSNPDYYRWTQWIFLQLYKSWYNHANKKAEPIETLADIFNTKGTDGVLNCDSHKFSADEWKSFSNQKQHDVLMEFRLAFSAYGEVNWCEALGTVLANDEVVNGVSERGGHPVIKKKMRQWYLRITDYAERLLEGLETVSFSDSMKEMQRNWIGRSEGCEMEFNLTPNPSPKGEGNKISIRTTDPDTWKKLKEFARENRKVSTETEDVLWQKLRDNQMGSKVRRQHVIEGFIIDFAFLNEKLLIEIDGDYHNEEMQAQYDEQRTACLHELGYEVLRFSNEEVLEKTDKVVEEIALKIKNKSPLSLGRGAGGEVKIKIYTTRPDTIFGVDFLVLAPEHELVSKITSDEQKEAIEKYLTYVKSRSDRERIAEVKQISGCFTGAYATNPFNGKQIPIWIAEYVLSGYGTGAIMAVPCGDQRDFLFAKHFNIPVTNIIGNHFNGTEANPTKEAVLENSDFLNGILMKDAIKVAIEKIESLGIGKRKVNYKMRDAGFSRQRYWGEPFPIKWEDGIAVSLDENSLPLELPHVEKYGPGPEGEGPLANIQLWKESGLETSTMPGYAGSSWYFLRYMDPKNNQTFCDRKASDYWGQVDVYVGGTEHAVGHLLYSRMWTKVLFDLGLIGFDEPFKKLVNQGMIQGSSRFVYRIKGTNKFVSFGLKSQYETDELHADVNMVDGFELDVDAFRKWKPDHAEAEFILEDGKYVCGAEVEKMSKSKFNTVNPDDLVNKYGADTFRMYEMFLGPIEQSKPWDTKGIEGVHRFLRKLWRMFFDDVKGKVWNEEIPTDAEFKILHKTIKKIEFDTENFSFNTAVSAFMVCVNELAEIKCHKKAILEKVLILLTPYAPHIAEELWMYLGNSGSILNAEYPKYDEKYLIETSKEYPVSVNGKVRTNINIDLAANQSDVEKIVLDNEIVQKWLEGKSPKKIIFVKGKMVNIVV
jgi:leucyl-tRNA synthetase